MAGSTNQISLQTLNTAVSVIQKTDTIIIVSASIKNAYLNPDLSGKRCKRNKFNHFPDHSQCDVKSSSSRLLRLKSSSIDGSPLKKPEYSNVFVATVHILVIPTSEKMSHLGILFTATARGVIANFGYSGGLYGETCALLEREIGQPYLFQEAKLNTLGYQQAIRMQDSKNLVMYSTTISNVVCYQKHCKRLSIKCNTASCDWKAAT